MTVVMHQALYQFLFKLVISLWVLPFRVFNDERASRDVLYLCQPKFWRQCCRRRAQGEPEGRNDYQLMEDDRFSEEDNDNVRVSDQVFPFESSELLHLDEL